MIVPIALEVTREEVEAKVMSAKQQGARRFHIDIIDGLFADNITVAPADLEGIDFGPMELDIHLLVDDPVEWLPECVALSPRRIYAQVERMGSIHYYLKAMREYKGIMAGLGVGLGTSLETQEKEGLLLAECLLLMAIEPGFAGQPFEPEVLPRIEALREDYGREIFVDGGINPTTYRQVLAAGADSAGANTAYWRGDFGRGKGMYEEER